MISILMGVIGFALIFLEVILAWREWKIGYQEDLEEYRDGQDWEFEEERTADNEY